MPPAHKPQPRSLYEPLPRLTVKYVTAAHFLPLFPSRAQKFVRLRSSQLVLPSLTQLCVSAAEVQTLDWQSAAAHTTVNPVYWTILLPPRHSEVVRRGENPEA